MRVQSEESWTIEIASAAAETFRRTRELAGSPLSLVRFGTNALFEAGDADYVLRVGRPGTDPDRVAAQMELAMWLVSNGFPANRPMSELGIDSPAHGSTVVSAWERVRHSPASRVEPDAFGAILAAFHAQTRPFVPLRFGTWDPFATLRVQLDLACDSGVLSPRERLIISDCALKLEGNLHEHPSVLGVGLIHGDAHTGNVLCGADGPVLIDFDQVSVGPREWDLVPLEVGLRRFFGSGIAYESFVRGYGFDLRTWDGFPTLRDLRELGMTVWLASVARTPELADEVRRRLSSLVERAHDVRWHAL